MPSISSLILKLKADYPKINLVEAETFAWSPADQTILYNPKLPDASGLLLHELSHGLLNHHDYQRDIELVSMETSAWERAKELAANYDISIEDEVTQDHLDTYREWLHSRSTCPNCQAKFYDLGRRPAHCPKCATDFDPEEALKLRNRRGRPAGYPADDTEEDQVKDKKAEGDDDEEEDSD